MSELHAQNRAFLTRWTVPTPPVDPGAYLCVLSSSSAGNCSLLRVHDGVRFRHILIDLGLSPRRTRELLSLFGLTLRDVDAALVTHLDLDHVHHGWYAAPGKASPLRDIAPVFVHESHLYEARHRHLHRPKLLPISPDGESQLFAAERHDSPSERITVAATLSSHDEEGTASFRLRLPGGGTLGYVTDVGRFSDALCDLCREVSVLAIESNYCPDLQARSDRPDFLKRRITGGSGHLSNHEAMLAIQHAQPKSHVVLLHLSRQCNNHQLVAQMHEGADYGWTIAEPDRPCRWVSVIG